MAALRIRQDYSAFDLRQRAARERDTRASLRLLAIANALEGMTRAEAARLAGMERGQPSLRLVRHLRTAAR